MREKQKERSAPTPPLDVEHAVTVTLQEAYTGTTRLVTLASGRRLEVMIPPGVATGTRIRVAGYSRTKQRTSSGEFFLRITVSESQVFSRLGDDLYHRLTVPQSGLAKGGIFRVRTLTGSILNVMLPEGTRDGHLFRLAGEGMPCLANPAKKGDLFVLVTTNNPYGTDDIFSRQGIPRTPREPQTSPRGEDREDDFGAFLVLGGIFLIGLLIGVFIT